MSRSIIIIPARIQASRLPRKPLAEIGGEPMIVHVWRRAVAAGAGDVFVATDSPEIAEAVGAAGAQAIMTRDDHASGSDRVHEAAATLEAAGEADIIVNIQGDLPTMDPSLVRACVAPLEDPEVDIATLAAEIDDPACRDNRSQCGQGDRDRCGRGRDNARAILHPRSGAFGLRPVPPSHRDLCLPTHGAGPVRLAAGLAAGAA
jgi:CMP-2-keto-3-deoxyoctulosonic acid synthetase